MSSSGAKILTPELKKRCVGVLQNPNNEGEMNALLDCVATEDANMAEHLRCFVETGQTKPYGNKWSHEGVVELGTQYVIVRVIPKDFGVRFACSCAKQQALPVVNKLYPEECSPYELLGLVERWLVTEVTKDKVKKKYEEFALFASQIEKEFQAKIGSGEIDSVSNSVTEEFEAPLLAVDIISYSAQSIGFTNNATAWLKSIDLTTREHLNLAEMLHGKRGRTRAKKWQIKRLVELVTN